MPLHKFLAAAIVGVGVLCILGTGGSGDSEFFPNQHRISGTVRAPENMLVDSDVNDPNAPYESNDTFDTAQKLINPVVVGGYLNMPGLGSSGRSQIGGDTEDIYRVTLAAGQIVTLFVSDPSTDATLSLRLYAVGDTGIPVDAASGVVASGSVAAAESGDYFLVVTIDGGYANYNLTVGQSIGGLDGNTPSNPTTMTADFIPDQVIIRFKESLTNNPASIRSADMASSLGMRWRAGNPGRSMLMSFSEPAERQLVFKSLGIKSDRSLSARVGAVSAIEARQETLKVIQALRQRPDVLYAEPNYIRQAALVPDDAQYAYQWHYPAINLPQAWDITTGNTNVVVAVIDTGVLLNHPDLQGRLTGGYDFISDPTFSLDGDGIDDNPDDPGDQAVGGSSFHGTHVAGTVGALTDNGSGVAGVTWSTRIMPLRVLGLYGGTSYDIQQAILYAAGLANDSDTVPTQPADIINLSLGGSQYSAAEQAVIDQARSQGIIIVAAAGNESSASASYPAAYNGVVSVSAVDLEFRLAWYSNFGASIDIAAPGGDRSADLNNDGYPDGVLSTAGDDSGGSINFVYSRLDGTSMASPHVAGVAALMKSIYSQLTPDQFDLALEAGLITEDLGAAGRDNQFGYGLIDALKAVQEAQRLNVGGGLPAVIVANPKFINIGSDAADQISVVLTVQNGGEENLFIQSVSVNTLASAWISVTPTTIDANGLGEYRVDVDKTDLALGLYSAYITIASDDTSDVVLPVTLRNGFFIGGGNSGFHYIMLVDANSNRRIAQSEVGFSSMIGGYPFEFAGLAPGQYYLYAGTDLDNDYILGDGGESFGAYLTIDQPTTLTLSDNLTDLDFNTGFNFSLPSALPTVSPRKRN